MDHPLRIRRFGGIDGSEERALVVEVGGYRGASWLLFFAFRPQGGVVERRRLTTVPPNWQALPEASLVELFNDAAPVRPARTTPLGASARGDGPAPAPDADGQLDSARSALDIAHQQLDALAMALADCEAELERTREELATLNAEVQGIYDRAARKAAAAGSPRYPAPRSSTPPND